MSTRNGGTAFPIQDSQAIHVGGMSLRDYFAAKAMAVIYAQHWDWNESHIAKRAYEMADAMLAEQGDA